jgi:hypothetical protein
LRDLGEDKYRRRNFREFLSRESGSYNSRRKQVIITRRRCRESVVGRCVKEWENIHGY